ncbi:aldose epimerase family protein [Ahrensia sp. 13_GOM-1096m]|uniref:aldose epimerase family protein n=1 Tax=Ahrensia sp. 13_GOM-1096m TaxID=1380380 RepID=UPI00047AF3E9|nr:aldose epimerase family protein [Ahrensia sp. 13_GOM-1096m]
MLEAANIKDWGTTKSGSPVKKITLHNGALTASIITYGAVVQDLRLQGHNAPLVLGFDRLEAYENNRVYFGAIIGRCANRVSNGTCTIEGREYQLERAEGEIHHLHGGPNGFYSKCWDIVEISESAVKLQLVSEDGEAGYPGKLIATCTYHLTDDNALSIKLEAQSDKATLCNLTNHSYFNLEDGGSNDVSLHRLRVDAERYLVPDDTLVPTGEIADVSQTLYDFRVLRPIGDFKNYDHNFCLADTRRPLTEVARVSAPSSGVEMDVLTTEPGVHFYASRGLSVLDTGLDGRAYELGAGICLETQIWPDAINNAAFPTSVLRPNEVLTQHTIYRFSKVS